MKSHYYTYPASTEDHNAAAKNGTLVSTIRKQMPNLSQHGHHQGKITGEKKASSLVISSQHFFLSLDTRKNLKSKILKTSIYIDTRTPD